LRITNMKSIIIPLCLVMLTGWAGDDDSRSKFFKQFQGYWVAEAIRDQATYSEPRASIFIDGNGVHYFQGDGYSTRKFSYGGVSFDQNGMPIYSVRFDDNNKFTKATFTTDGVGLTLEERRYVRRDDAPATDRAEYMERAREALSLKSVDVKLLGKADQLKAIEENIAALKRDAITPTPPPQGEDPNIAILEANAEKFRQAGTAFAQDAVNEQTKAQGLRRNREFQVKQYEAAKRKAEEAQAKLAELEAARIELMNVIRADIKGSK